MRPVYSVIVPCYNEEAVLHETHKRLTQVLSQMGESYEIVYINDGSRDKTPDILRELAAQDSHVRAVMFARNAGHQLAVTAGLDYATGDAIVIIDADLQDPPELIPQMAEKWKSGVQVVFAQRNHRAGETAFKKITASAYYKLLNSLTGGMVPRDTGDFRLVDKQVADVVRSMPEHNRFLRGMFAWVGFKQEAILYDRDKRFAGETHYPLKKDAEAGGGRGVFLFRQAPQGHYGPGPGPAGCRLRRLPGAAHPAAVRRGRRLMVAGCSGRFPDRLHRFLPGHCGRIHCPHL